MILNVSKIPQTTPIVIIMMKIVKPGLKLMIAKKLIPMMFYQKAITNA